MRLAYGFITSQGDTAPKLNIDSSIIASVSLPVRVTLLQNHVPGVHNGNVFHYQSG